MFELIEGPGPILFQLRDAVFSLLGPRPAPRFGETNRPRARKQRNSASDERGTAANVCDSKIPAI